MRDVVLFHYFSGIESIKQRLLLWPRRAKTCLQAYADSKGPGQSAHPRSLSGLSLSANRIIGYYEMYEWKVKAWMIHCACAGWSDLICACSKALFRFRRPICCFSFVQCFRNIFPSQQLMWNAYREALKLCNVLRYCANIFKSSGIIRHWYY